MPHYYRKSQPTRRWWLLLLVIPVGLFVWWMLIPVPVPEHLRPKPQQRVSKKRLKEIARAQREKEERRQEVMAGLDKRLSAQEQCAIRNAVGSSRLSVDVTIYADDPATYVLTRTDWWIIEMRKRQAVRDYALRREAVRISNGLTQTEMDAVMGDQ